LKTPLSIKGYGLCSPSYSVLKSRNHKIVRRGERFF